MNNKVYMILGILLHSFRMVKGILKDQKNVHMELVHTNLYEPFNVHVWAEYGWFITFNDDYSRFG